MFTRLLRTAILCFSAASLRTARLATGQDGLANNTVLIVRHAEKPLTGRDLTTLGQERARAYATYFEPFHEDGLDVYVDALFSGADSESSIRPRLTLEPLSRATGLKLDTSVSTTDSRALVALLRTQKHGPHPLIAWRHHEIPALLEAFGASKNVLPGGAWPDETYDWVVVLQFDDAGKLLTGKLVHEHLALSKRSSQ